MKTVVVQLQTLISARMDVATMIILLGDENDLELPLMMTDVLSAIKIAANLNVRNLIIC